MLFALLPVAGLRAVWSADEGALLRQVDHLEAGNGWVFDHPFPEADPGGSYAPIHLSSWADRDECPSPETGCHRTIALAKHVIYLWIATGLYGLGGYGAIVVLSVAGTVAAAIAAGRLAGSVEPSAATPALWLTGLASPLLINSYVAWAHTVGAALVGWALYGLTRHARSADRSGIGAPRWLGPVAGSVALAAAPTVRTEGALAGIAIGLGLLTVGLLPIHRDRPAARRQGLATGALALVATGGGIAIDALTATPTGGPTEAVGLDESHGFLAGRFEALSITWLQPGYDGHPADLAILVAAAAVLAAAVAARRGPDGIAVVRPLLVAAVVALALRMLVAPGALVPGLVMAFPVLFAGLILLRRRDLADPRLAELVLPFALFCAAVLATQYRYGGGGEWGGRYFAIGLPLGVAAATVGLVRAARRFPTDARRQLGALLLASIALLGSMGLYGLRSVRHRTAELGRQLEASLVAPGDGDDRPVVVTTIDAFPRWLWSDLDRARWLRVPEDDLGSLADRLRSLGIEGFTLVSTRPDQDAARLGPWFQPETGSEERSGGDWFLVLSAAG